MPAYSSERESLELGGDRFVLRPIRPEDRDAYADFIARFDASDLRRRFFHPSGLFPEIDLERYVAVDHDQEVAFVAVARSRSGKEEIVGEARVQRYPGTSTAELAIMVRTDMQRRGLGSALMRKAIEYCAAHGLEMIAQILPENAAMIALAKRSGMQVEQVPGSDLAVAHIRPAHQAREDT
jgi:acetyltransferase